MCHGRSNNRVCSRQFKGVLSAKAVSNHKGTGRCGVFLITVCLFDCLQHGLNHGHRIIWCVAGKPHVCTNNNQKSRGDKGRIDVPIMKPLAPSTARILILSRRLKSSLLTTVLAPEGAGSPSPKSARPRRIKVQKIPWNLRNGR